MSKFIYILLISVFAISSCGTTNVNTLSKSEQQSLNKAIVKKAVEDQRLMINVNRIIARRGSNMQTRPENNFIIINRDHIVINLPYVGRSHSTRPIAAINMQGQILSREIAEHRKGGYEIKMEAKQGSEKFRLNITISNDGYVSLGISNPRIDYTRYSGIMSILES